MYKYFMTIDGDTYTALFLDHMEASDFLDANNRDGAEVIVHGYDRINCVEDILNDMDFEGAYIDEMACIFLLGQAECKKRFPKVCQMHEYLQIMGYLN